MPSSYSEEDITFLLRDLSHIEMEHSTAERERRIQQGTNYAEMLPVEVQPNEQYMALFDQTLAQYAPDIATAVGVVAEKILETKPLEQLVLVSLARAGTPIGILLKRYYAYKYRISVPHYSISIIRERGIDETALLYIVNHHPQSHIQFIDGWTGKGAITKELTAGCQTFNETYNKTIDATLAVLADPAYCADIYGTREDFFIPSACLNSTVSGLVSRTVLNKLYLKEGDFHGAKYYGELAQADVSVHYIDAVVAQFDMVEKAIKEELQVPVQPTNWQGMQAVEKIQQRFTIKNINHIKPGIGETTRVLLRRVPWKILVNPAFEQHLAHIYLLAQERGVPVEPYSDMSYACCGLIKEMK